MASNLYVSPHGDDRNPGTRANPLATLSGARQAVRRLKRGKHSRDIVVWFAGGTYRLSETVVLGLRDSAPRGGTVTYSAIGGRRPVFSAGVPITGWRKLTDLPKGLPARARGKVWAADVPAGLDGFHTLFDGNARLPRARCKGFSPTKFSKGWSGDKEEDRWQIHFPAGAMKRWDNLADVEVCIVPAAPWTMNVLPLESVDTRKRIARTAVRGTYMLGRPRFGKFQKGSVFVENVFEGMHEPGNWVLDTIARKIYLWPAGKKPSRNIVAPCLTEFVRVEGKVDYDGPTDTPVRGIVFRGLTFTHGERYTWQDGQLGWGLQHDWEMFDRPTAMVRFRGAEDCALEACRLANGGSTAVRLDLHCQGNRIADNLIERVGGAGVLLAGYGPGTKDVNNHNAVVNNHIHHVGETYWHSAGVFTWQSGSNRIANNHIHHVPYTGIVVSGRIGMDPSGRGECSKTVRWKEVDAVLGGGRRDWHAREPLLHARRNIIEHNDVHDVMEMLEDGNCVYVSGCGALNVVRENYLHHCESIHMAEGIRCDDDQHETLIDGNILFRIGGLATYIAVKGVNHVVNNILAWPVKATFRGLLSLEHVPVQGSVIQRNIFYAVNRRDIACFQGQTYYKSTTRLADTLADWNVYFNAADANWGRRHLEREQAGGVEAHSLAADPMFANIAKGDFRLKKGSPALALGFRPIDMKRIGLTGKVGPALLRQP